MLNWLASLLLDRSAREELVQLSAERDRLQLAYDAKSLECDLQGEIIVTLRSHVLELLAVQKLRLDSIPREDPGNVVRGVG